MQRVSTSATLLLKFFIPTFWIVFFGFVNIGLFFLEFDFMGRIPSSYIQFTFLSIYILIIFMMWRTLFKLKRIEMDEEYIYATNYFKTFRYSYESIASVSEQDYLIFKTLSFHLKEAGTFGKKISCIQSHIPTKDYGHFYFYLIRVLSGSQFNHRTNNFFQRDSSVLKSIGIVLIEMVIIIWI